MHFPRSAVPAAAVLSGIIAPKDLNVNSTASVRNVAATIAHDAMFYYKGNLSAPGSVQVGDLPDPYYWWVAGALWGAMLDYYHYTRDPTYNDVVIQALLNPPNISPKFDYMPAEHAGEEGNDDLFFWGSAAMSAAERNFPQPVASAPPWLDIAVNVFNSLVSRWDYGNCGGGLRWQIYPTNPNGMNYKNSISNGGLFQLAARLARATGNETYTEWARKAWDWTASVGLIDPQTSQIYDGVDIKDACKKVNKLSFSYTTGVYLYGAAVMANHTGEDLWVNRTSRLLDGAAFFFSKQGTIRDVMFEPSCEPYDRCNFDMVTFKGYLSRFMWQTSVMLPALRERLEGYLVPSAKAAVNVCIGGTDGHQCGMKWYTGAFDGKIGLGPQMCALEAVQGLLAQYADAPLKGDDLQHVTDANWTAINTYSDMVITPQSNSSALWKNGTRLLSNSTRLRPASTLPPAQAWTPPAAAAS
ncbi:hypothetical protein RJ55_08109 [Drechmeria coniospora]|nr:hypothetical protein RJ55_08109 [Drechmeria coniospora]